MDSKVGMAKQELCKKKDAENETELDLHPYQLAGKWKELMSTDVEHEQAQYVAREIVTPTAYRRKSDRTMSQPPPSRGRSNQCSGLYFGGNASHWWWPHWQYPIGGKWQRIQQQEVAEDTTESPRPLRDPAAPRPEGSSIYGFYGDGYLGKEYCAASSVRASRGSDANRDEADDLDDGQDDSSQESSSSDGLDDDQTQVKFAPQGDTEDLAAYEGRVNSIWPGQKVPRWPLQDFNAS